MLILDEPTAVLTPQEVQDLFATLRGFVDEGLAVIFISHKLDEVMAVSRRVAVLRQGKLVAERDTARHQPRRTGGTDGGPQGRHAARRSGRRR